MMANEDAIVDVDGEDVEEAGHCDGEDGGIHDGPGEA
jgi:hypothetical protein